MSNTQFVVSQILIAAVRSSAATRKMSLNDRIGVSVMVSDAATELEIDSCIVLLERAKLQKKVEKLPGGKDEHVNRKTRGPRMG